MGKDYSNLSKDDLVRIINKLESRKKFGLVWDEERTKEKFEKDSENALPVLKEIRRNSIEMSPATLTHILIEGDNYHALSVLNYSHQNRIDCIYIDPPYNLGKKDFKYNDNWVDWEDSYRHSKWLSFMNKRLRLAKNLLKDTGIIFLSIDDNEMAQLRLLCDEVFGPANFIAVLPTVMNLKGNQDQFGFAGTHEYTLVYCKNIKQASLGEFPIEEEGLEEWLEDDLGYYKKGANLKATGVNAPREKRPNLFFPIFLTPKGNIYVTDDDKPKNREDISELPLTDGQEMSWRWSKKAIRERKNDLIVEMNNGGFTVYKKQRPSLGDLPSKKPKTIFYKPEYSSGNGTAQLKAMFGKKVFPNPKPIELIKDLIMIATDREKNSIVLDFMAGSGTTAHALLQQNREDGGNRIFILCTNNEEDICSKVCYPRVKMAMKGYTSNKGEPIAALEGNLRYFRTAFVKKTIGRDELKIRITAECTEMLCLREGVFKLVMSRQKFRIYQQGMRIMAVYYALDLEGLGQLKQQLDKRKGKKILYCFTLDPLGLNKDDFEDWQDVELEPIPQKILDIYEQIYEY